MTSVPSSPANPEAARQLPEGFVSMLRCRPNGAIILDALTASEPEVSIRLAAHRHLAMPADADSALWNPRLIYLPGGDRRPRFTFDPSLHQGLYYVQDASSAALPTVLQHALAQAGMSSGDTLRVLDACAAPGGKTTAIADAIDAPDTVIVANEYDRTRAASLVENLQRWGDPRIIATNSDAADFDSLHDYFDVICADVPCSGEGMMRKDADAVAQWSPALIRDCADTQRRIISSLWDALRPGGVMIYSTCTFNTAEDEDNVRYLIDELGATPLQTGLDGIQGIQPGHFEPGATPFPCAHFYPGMIRGEGLFVAAVHKPEADSRRQPKASKKKNAKAPVIPAAVKQWVTREMTWNADTDGNIIATPPTAAAVCADLAAARIRLSLTGIEIGTIKGRDIIPAHALATSQAIDTAAFTCVDLDWQAAVSYLQRQAPVLPDGTPRGIVLLTYRHRPLGFAKNLGNRANSLLPPHRRIISPHLPDTPVIILP